MSEFNHFVNYEVVPMGFVIKGISGKLYAEIPRPQPVQIPRQYVEIKYSHFPLIGK